jgi:hypothetical protein
MVMMNKTAESLADRLYIFKAELARQQAEERAILDEVKWNEFPRSLRDVGNDKQPASTAWQGHCGGG